MRLSHQIVLASTNPDKFREFSSLFKAYPEVELISPEGLIRNSEKLAFAEIHSTYLENSIAKARLANQASHLPSLADDTGLEVNALGGKPGVKSHRYAKPPLTSGSAPNLVAQDRANIELLMSELKAQKNASREARFVTCLALVMEGILIHAEGILEGTIIDPSRETPRGEHGFGYDSIFIPKGSEKTLAELTEGEKNSFSHRARAVNELMLQIKARGIVFAKP